MASSETSPALMDEEGEIDFKFFVPMEMMNHPLGFVVDAGGSVTKVIYRSKEEYSRGKLIKPVPDLAPGQGVLHFHHFDMNQIGEVVDFLKDKCDVAMESCDYDVTWWMTGVTTQHFKKKLDQTFKIKTKLYSEMMAFNSFVKNFDKLNLNVYDLNVEAVNFAKRMCTVLMKTFIKWDNLGETTMSHLMGKDKNNEGSSTNGSKDNLKTLSTTTAAENSKPEATTSNTSDSDLQAMMANLPIGKLLFGNDTKKWIKDHLAYQGDFETPALLIHLGSAVPVALIDNDHNLSVVDAIPGAGKTLCGMAEQMTGEKSFHKFIKMAERGCPEKVHVTVGDAMSQEHTEEDWYSGFPEDIVVFDLGKLASSNVKGKGTFNNDDLAAGLLQLEAKRVAKMAYLNAKVYNAKTILFSGSLIKYSLIREYIEKCLITDIVINNFKGIPLVKMHSVRHPGFICALGVWLENVEIEKKKSSQEQVRL